MRAEPFSGFGAIHGGPFTGKQRLRSFNVPRKDQMNVHKNASLTPKDREAMVRSVVEGGL